MGAGAEALKYRFQWTFPIVFSPHDPNVLYVAGNRVFRSTDEGTSWEVVSPDLTRNDPEQARAVRRADHAATTPAPRSTARSSPSPSRRTSAGVLWAGTDDGLVHLSRDGGKTWQNDHAAATCPEWALISIIEPSPHDAGTAYLAATRYKLDDTAPYLFKTERLRPDLDARSRTASRTTTSRASIREDPERPGLLYAGTETGIYVSFDDGGNWQRLRRQPAGRAGPRPDHQGRATSSSRRTAARSGSWTT